jgi:hypothetical protein
MAPRPFSTERLDTLMPVGLTLKEMLEATQPDSLLLAHAHVYVGDQYIPRDRWHRVRPKSGVRVTCRVVPAGGGGGGGGKSPMRIILTIAVVAAAAYLGPQFAAYMTGLEAGSAAAAASTAFGVYSAVGTAVVGMAGMMLINAVAPVRPPQMGGLSNLGGTSERASPTLFITGARNAASPFGVVPRPLGFHRMVPPLGALSYTEVVGEEQYLRMLVAWGYGPLEVTDLRIGETPIEDFEDVEIETRTGLPTDLPLTLFPGDVYEEGLSVALSAPATNVVPVNASLPANAVFVERTCDAAGTLGLTVTLPNGLGAAAVPGTESYWDDSGYHPGSPGSAAVYDEAVFEVQVAPEAGTSWSSATVTSISGPGVVHQGSGVFTITGATSSQVVASLNVLPPVEGERCRMRVRRYSGAASRVATWVDYSASTLNWQSRTSRADADELGIDITFPQGIVRFNDSGGRTQTSVTLEIEGRKVGTTPWIPVKTLTVTDAKSSAIRVGHRWAVSSRGQYEVRIRRVTSDSTDTRRYDSSAWTALRTFTNEDPIAMVGVAKTAIRIKATGQLNGTVDQLNGTVKSVVPDYDHVSGTWVTRATNNPASLIRAVLQGAGNARPLADSRVDLDGLEEFHDHCRTGGLTFNQVRDFRASVWDTLADVASAGFATPAIRDGKWGVVVDRARASVSQVFTPRNSWGMEVEHLYLDRPHGWRVRFVNEDQDYRQDERIVYDDGYSSANATKFEGLELPGVTDPDHVWKAGRRHIAAGRLRSARYSFFADIEHLVCTRGDRIRVSHDVIGVGLGAARVKTVILDGSGAAISVVLDDEVPMTGGGSYAMIVRNASSMDNAINLVNVGVPTKAVTPTPPAYPPPQVGDLVVFGEVGNVTRDLIVLGIEPGREMSAKLTCLDYAPAIYAADQGAIPPFASLLTPIPGMTVPVIAAMRSDESVLDRLPDGTLLPRVLVTFGLVSARSSTVGGVEVQYRMVGTGTWQASRSDGRDVKEVFLTGVQQAQTYEIRARFYGAGNRAGEWSTTQLHWVVGKTTPPPNVTGLVADVRAEGVYLRWDPVTVLDFKEYFVYGTPDSFQRYQRFNELFLGPLSAGAKTYHVYAVDAIGLNSNAPATVSFTIAPPGAPSISTQVIDNFVTLQFVSVQGSHFIKEYEVRRGPTTDDELVQVVQGTFATVLEPTAGSYTYWVTAIDVAGNRGAGTPATGVVTQPPDFVLLQTWDSTLGGSRVNALVEEAGRLLLPVNTTRTWEDHFVSRGWASPQDQIDAGLPWFMQPTEASAQYVEVLDYGATIRNIRVTITPDRQTISGAVSMQPRLEVSTNGTDYTVLANAWQAVASEMRYLRVTVDFTAADETSLASFDMTVRLDVQLKDDAGMGTASAADASGTQVNFNLQFIDVTSITVTPGGGSARFAVYDFVDAAYPTSFRVMLFDKAGTRVSGPFSWAVRGY